MPRIKKPTLPDLSRYKVIQTGEKYGFKVGDVVRFSGEKYKKHFGREYRNPSHKEYLLNTVGYVAGFHNSHAQCIVVYFKDSGFQGVNGTDTYTLIHSCWDKV